MTRDTNQGAKAPLTPMQIAGKVVGVALVVLVLLIVISLMSRM